MTPRDEIETQDILARITAVRLMHAAEFKAFSDDDFAMFAGVESDHPFIAEVSADKAGGLPNWTFILVLDGANLLVVHPEDMGGGFQIALTAEEVAAATPVDARPAERAAYGRPV
jgi:hypothetical protein